MESTRIRQLQELLVVPPPMVAARAERRRWVEDALHEVLMALVDGDLSLGEWERRCVLLALEAMRDGLYDIAMFHVQSVLAAEEHRARQSYMMSVADLDLEEIRESFELSRSRPI